MSKTINVFCTGDDITTVLKTVESLMSVKYVSAGSFASAVVGECAEYTYLADLGVAMSGDQNHNPRYLVLPADTAVDIKEIPQRRGGVRYAVDQRQNPESVCLIPGGVFNDEAVIAGQIGTCTDDEASLALMEVFRRVVKNHFRRIGSYWVGPAAEQLLDRGYRLTAGINQPRENDLMRESPTDR